MIDICYFSGLTLPVNEVKGEIRFSNVNFAYPSRPDVTLFKDLDFFVPAGKN